MKVLQTKKTSIDENLKERSSRPSALSFFLDTMVYQKLLHDSNLNFNSEVCFEKNFEKLQTRSVTLMHNSSTCLSCLVVIYKFSKSHRSISRRR